MSDLIDNVYLPDFNKRSIRESDAYKLLKDNNKDTSVIEGYENHPDAGTVNFESFDKFLGEGGTKEEWVARHATPEVQKEFFSNVGDFMLETGKDTVLSLATAVVNGADVATNLMPLFVKALSKAPYAQIGIDESFLNEATEKQVYDFANNVSNNLGEAREFLNEFKKDDNFASQLIGVMSQDLLYSIPIYNKLRAAGIPKYPAFFISGGFGGAIGIEQKIMGAESTFSQEFFAKDIIELKNLIGIIPNTPEDKIADEVIQALEYGAFSAAIPGIIDAFKFMKQYVPAMTATTGATIGMTADNEAEGSPLKAIVNAVDNIPMFKSAVVDAADNIPTVASGDQIFNTIKNTTGVKESELKWMDLEGFLKGKNKVSKDEVLEYINTNKIDVAEVKLANTQSANKESLPRELVEQIDEYETRWRNTYDLAGSPNYDQFRFKSTTYATGRLVNNLGEPTQAQVRALASETGEDTRLDKIDWQSVNRSPLIRAMDDELEITGDTIQYFDIKKYNLKSQPWFDDKSGNFVGHVIDLFEEQLGESYYRVSSSPSLDKTRVVVPQATIDRLINDGINFDKVAKYQLEPLELERFLLEDRSRNFKLNNTDQMPIFERYTSPGGEEYTELVFKIKNKEGTTPAILEGEFGTLGNNKVKSAQRTSINYTSPHFNKMNEFAHVRFKTRTLDNGKKVLTVEEMQSDLLQASKTELFDSANRATFNAPSGDKVLKDFPFKNSWYEFTIKRLTRYAADNGFDAIAIPKGELAANRYGQNINKLKKIEVTPFDTNTDFIKGDQSIEPGFAVKLLDENDKVVGQKTLVGFPGDEGFYEEMGKVLRKDVGDKNYADVQQLILDASESVEGTTLEKVFDEVTVVGSGKGKFDLYNKTIPSYMKKYAKKWNAKVYDNEISMDMDDLKKMPVTVLELSDEMKTGVQSSSQPLFELFGGVSLATWGAQAVSDSMENNIISQKTN